MFQHQHRLTHLLRPHHYFDAGHYAKELDALFRPSWQFLASPSELPRDGDFITLEVAGMPLILRNFSGELRCFVNVCPHRHACLTDQPSGNSDTLRCQYHGWEFNAEGKTGRIPEAKAFRPWDRENSHLRRVRLECCGDMAFATLDDDMPSLREWMGPLHDEIEASFSAPTWRMRETWEFETPCNWKIPTENTLESYHVGAVHPSWMGGALPPEEFGEHALTDNYTTLSYLADGPLERRQMWACRVLGETPAGAYRHYHIHPNIAFCMTDTFNFVATCQPTSPTTSRLRTRMFALHGAARGPFAAFVRHVCWRLGRKTMIRVFNEDRGIFGPQQRGMQASDRPGVLGAREERVYQFQEYVCGRLGLPLGLPLDMPPSDGDAHAPGVGLKVAKAR